MEIRYIKPEDNVLAASRLIVESWKETYRGDMPRAYLDHLSDNQWCHKIRDKKLETALAFDEGELVGVVIFGPTQVEAFQGYGEVVSLHLKPDQKGGGYGSALFSFAIEELEKAGYDKIFLYVVEGNHNARRFYEKNGFVPLDGVFVHHAFGEEYFDMIYVNGEGSRP